MFRLIADLPVHTFSFVAPNSDNSTGLLELMGGSEQCTKVTATSPEPERGNLCEKQILNLCLRSE